MYAIYRDSNDLWFLGKVGEEEVYPVGSCKMKWKGTYVEIWTINGYESKLLYSGDVTSFVDGNQVNYLSKADFLTRVRNFFVEAPAPYGSIYGAENSVALSVPQGTTWLKATPFNANGLFSQTIPDHTNDQITIKVKGTYIVFTTFSSSINTNNTTLDTAVFKNGVECPNLHGQRLIVNANFISVNGLSGMIHCEVGDIIDVRIKHNYSGTVSLLTRYSGLNLNLIDYN